MREKPIMVPLLAHGTVGWSSLDPECSSEFECKFGQKVEAWKETRDVFSNTSRRYMILFCNVIIRWRRQEIAVQPVSPSPLTWLVEWG